MQYEANVRKNQEIDRRRRDDIQGRERRYRLFKMHREANKGLWGWLSCDSSLAVASAFSKSSLALSGSKLTQVLKAVIFYYNLL